MVINELWNAHLSQQPYEKSREELELLEKTLGCQEKLLETMTKEQCEMFEEYSQMSNALSSMSSERAFATGVRFATGYIIETLGMK